MTKCDCGSDPNGGESAVLFNKDFVAFLVSIALAFVVFTGFAYRAALFKTLGVPLAEQEFDFGGLLLRGLNLMQVWYIGLGASAFFGILLLTYFQTSRARPLLHYGSMALMFVGATWGAGLMGSKMGTWHAALMTTENYGTPAVCVLRPKGEREGTSDSEDLVRGIFEQLSGNLQLKIVSETKDFMYFAVQLEEAPAILKGQSIAIPKKDIAYCRLIGR